MSAERTALPASRAANDVHVPIDRWLRHLEWHVPLARAGIDPEGVHQMRVAIGRLRVWSKLAGQRGVDDELRWLRDRFSAVRDLDVELGAGPPAEIAAVLRRRHERLQKGVVATLDGARFRRLLADLHGLPPASAKRLRRRLPKLAHLVRERARAARRHDYDFESLHALRRGARRLRFALEWLALDPGALVKMQDALGAACDANVKLRALRDGQVTRAAEYRTELVRERRHAKRDALAALPDVRRRLQELS